MNNLSLEMSKKINFKKETEMYWYRPFKWKEWWVLKKVTDKRIISYKYTPAPNIAELADALKEHIECIRTDKYVENWEVTICEKEVTFSNYFKSTVFTHPHLIEALGLAYQNLTELGIIK